MSNSPQKKPGRVIPFERDGEFFLRRGSQRLERNNLVDAINNYNIAYMREPENIEAQLAIAEVLTEMHRYEQSNQLLFPLLSITDSPSECFFGIACNFLGLQEFAHAHDSLENYLSIDPEGEFVQDALEILDMLEDDEILYSQPGVYPKKERMALNACTASRHLIENGQINDAIILLQDALDEYPELHFIRNNLALAYFCAKDYKQAMLEIQTVLEQEPDDIQAHCNMLLFLYAAHDEEGTQKELAFLRKAETQDPQDWNRMAVVHMELGNMDEALVILKRLQNVFPYDECTLHRLAICHYESGQYKLATDCYDRLLKIDPNDTIAAYYRKLCHKAANGEPDKIEWRFHYQVPYSEFLRRVKEINELSHEPREKLEALWKADCAFRAKLFWCLLLPDANVKRTLLSLIASFNDRESELALRHFLLDKMQPDVVKQDVFAMLKQQHASEPYIAYLNGSLVQSRVHLHKSNHPVVPASYQRVLELCIKNMQHTRTSDDILCAIDLFQQYLSGIHRLPKLNAQQVTAMAAALEYTACQEGGLNITRVEIAELYGVTLVRLRNAINRLLQGLDRS
ncbi:tetratricopeptide repeat protein [Eubacteriales bacterium OttesenSCG-928-K08]|nr:tetratricopeptide repeat protein [Eubacteriales bacterium OttesenSCG-928-K08]